MNGLLRYLFWLTAIIGAVAASYAAGVLGLLSFVILIGALRR